MADTLTPNLKLRVSSDLTADAKYNLNRIDSLASATKVENNGNLRVRSIRDIIITPESQDLGGNGTGGTVSVGEAGVLIDVFEVFAEVADFNDTPALLTELRFPELPANGVNYVGFAPPDQITANVIWTLPNADGTSSQVLVTDGSGNLGWATVATDALPESNINIGNPSDISTPVDTSAVGQILADTTNGLTIKTQSIINGMINNGAAISFSKLAALNPEIIPVTDASGVLTNSAVTAAELGYLTGVTSDIQTQIDGKQAVDADLTALAGLSSTGLIVRTAAGTAAVRTLVAGTDISITNADGVSGDITINNTATSYTDEEAQDAVGNNFMNTDSINLTYNDGVPTFSADLNLSAAAADADNFLADVSIEADGLRVQISNAAVQAAIGPVGGYAFDWLAADGTTLVINHGLNTRDITVQLYDAVTYETIYIDSIIRTDLDNITLTATEAPATAWRVLIQEI